jgi:hypothetical protein
MDMLRNQCIEATVDMIMSLHTLSETNAYANFGRSIMITISSCPISCIYIRIKLYSNRILPAFRASLCCTLFIYFMD